ncbi:hypothetical protein DFH06DRAFT_1345305 [Mycena polygramma]|nr:hypothetical protein DFH06DRAFT_1345305 [Mycena polygramma]
MAAAYPRQRRDIRPAAPVVDVDILARHTQRIDRHDEAAATPHLSVGTLSQSTLDIYHTDEATPYSTDNANVSEKLRTHFACAYTEAPSTALDSGQQQPKPLLNDAKAVSRRLFLSLSNHHHRWTTRCIAAPDLPPPRYLAIPQSSHCRMFPLGDVDLQREIRLDNDTGVASWPRRLVQRRIYAAKLKNRNVTVAMYQGEGAEEEWRQCMTKHRSLRHPNIVHIYGVVRSDGIQGTIFHGDLIPFKHYLDIYNHSPCFTVYIWAHRSKEFWIANNYLYSNFQRIRVSSVPRISSHRINGEYQLASECTLWIRHSTGGLCVDLAPPDIPTEITYMAVQCVSEVPGLCSANAPNMEVIAIDTLRPEDYHEVCSFHLRHSTAIVIPAVVSVALGVVVSRIANDRLVEIASLPDINNWYRSRNWDYSREVLSTDLENGWKRYL